MDKKLGTSVAGLAASTGPAGLARFSSFEEESQMNLTRAARTILSITALAWAIPFAQADDKLGDDKAKPRVGNARFIQLDANADGLLSQDEVKHLRGYAGAFNEAEEHRIHRFEEFPVAAVLGPALEGRKPVEAAVGRTDEAVDACRDVVGDVHGGENG
jgi:hypothetical protein